MVKGLIKVYVTKTTMNNITNILAYENKLFLEIYLTFLEVPISQTILQDIYRTANIAWIGLYRIDGISLSTIFDLSIAPQP